jgi:hypothetical protein
VNVASTPTVEIVIQGVQAVAVTVTLVVIAKQIQLQGRAVKAQTEEIEASKKATGFDTYQRIGQRYYDLIWRAAEDPSLNCIWDAFEGDRKNVLDAALANPDYGVWYVMTPLERRCYRYTRVVLETFEQAFQAYAKDFNDIGADEWNKWRGWIRIWKTTRYWPYVLAEAKNALLPAFLTELNKVEAGGAFQTHGGPPPAPGRGEG